MHKINLREIVQDSLREPWEHKPARLRNKEDLNEENLFTAYSEIIQIRIGGIQTGDIVTFTTDELYQFCQFVDECAYKGALLRAMYGREN